MTGKRSFKSNKDFSWLGYCIKYTGSEKSFSKVIKNPNL